MQNILVRCPVCSSEETISLTDEEVRKIVLHIREKGKSPLYLMKCKNNHTFTVILSYDKKHDKLYVRDISPVVSSTNTDTSAKNNENNDSWIKRHFG